MAIEKISWETTKDGVKISGEFEYDMPEGIEAKLQKYGEETVDLGFEKSARIYLQALARRLATNGEDPMSATEVANYMKTAKVSFSKRETVDPVEKIMAQFGKLSAEKRAAILASLEEMQG